MNSPVRFLRHWFACLGCLGLWLGPGSSLSSPAVDAPASPDAPNIVFILADDLGWGELGSYGQSKIRTPNLDRLAREGMRFTQHYSGAPVCAPSRCVLLTGQHTGHAEIRGNLQVKGPDGEPGEGQQPISADALTIAEVLHSAGYATGAMGKWGLGPVDSPGAPHKQGFDLFFGYNCQAVAHSYYPPHLWRNAEKVPLNAKPVPGHARQAEGEIRWQDWTGEHYAPDAMLSEAVKFLHAQRDRRFFLYLPFVEPHVALQPPRDLVESYPVEWDDRPYRGQNGYTPTPRPRAAYAAMITSLDRHVGRILATLDELKLAGKTVVVFTSDNGTTHEATSDPTLGVGGVDAAFFASTAGLRGRKGSLHEGGIRVPLLVRWPDRVKAGSIHDAPCWFADHFPTLCELAGVPRPAGLDGRSLVPDFQGRPAPTDRPPMVWVFPEYGGQVAVRLGDFKVIRKDLARTNSVGPWEVYDLARDRNETTDLASRRPDLIDLARDVLRREVRPNPRFPVVVPGLSNEAPRVSVERRDGNWWFVPPDGQRFFSLGACAVTPGAKRGSFDPENPSYAAWRRYASDRDWADATSRRLKSWGFTTLGGWGDYRTLGTSPEQDLWLTPVLHLGATAGAPWWDMWDPQVVERMESAAREQILAVREHPRLLGYYSDNELGWWNATLWKMTFEQSPTSGQRLRLLRLLRETYGDDWGRLTADFQAENAAGWRELEQGGILYYRSGHGGIRVMRQFLGIVADRYYRLVHDLIRKYDPRALILGDRYQSFYYPEVVVAAAPWVDVISSNLNANWNDGTFLRCYLETLHDLAKKPVLVSEFYLAARENRTGNRNNQGLFPVVETQAERAAAARTTLAGFARTPYVIGADWFQFHDEPRFGRDDGENFNFGLVDIDDVPYAEVTSMFADFSAAAIRDGDPGTPGRPDASGGIPPAPAEPLRDFRPSLALKHWDRERGFVRPKSPHPLADLYVCWSPDALYLGLYALDITEDALYPHAWIPKGDRSLWTVTVPGHAPIRARLGLGRDAIPSDPSIRVENLSGVNLSVRNIAAMEIKASQVGRDRFRVGDRMELASTFLTHCQAYRMDWQGAYTLKN